MANTDVRLFAVPGARFTDTLEQEGQRFHNPAKLESCGLFGPYHLRGHVKSLTTSESLTLALAPLLDPKEKLTAVFQQDAKYMGKFVLLNWCALLVPLFLGALALSVVMPVAIGASIAVFVILLGILIYRNASKNADHHFYALTSYRVLDIWLVGQSDSSIDRNRVAWLPTNSIRSILVARPSGNDLGTLKLVLANGKKKELAGIINVSKAQAQLQKAKNLTNRPGV